jgi:hypothetical protein
MVRNIIPARNQCRDEPRNTADAIAVRSAATAAHSLARVPARTVGLPSGAASVIELTLCADQPGVFAYEHIDLRPIRPVTTRVHLHTGCCPRCKRRVAARPPVDMRPGSPFGSGIAALVTYLHLIEAARHTRLFIPVLLGVTTGIRRGEAVALRWRNVDFGNAQLSIAESAEQTRAGVRYKRPKSGKGAPWRFQRASSRQASPGASKARRSPV